MAPLYMNIYTARMYEADKAILIRSLAMLMLAFYIIKLIDLKAKGSPFYEESIEEKTAKSFFSLPLAIAFGAFVFFYLISCIFSIIPYDSLWGSYGRQQGLYTNLSLWAIFLLIVVNLKNKSQIDRIITVAIASSILVVGYGFLQMLKSDVIFWQSNPYTFYFSATFGDMNYLSAYLVIIIPLTLSRFVMSFTLRMYKKLSRRRIVFYGTLAALQIVTVFLSQNIGAILATIIGVFVFLMAYAIISQKRRLLKITVAVFIFVIAFLILFNLPHIIPSVDMTNSLWQNIFGGLSQTSFVENLGKIGDVSYGSDGRINLLMWKTALKAASDKSQPYRFFVGYGPESIPTVSLKHYNKELALVEAAPINSGSTNNGYIDMLLNNGILTLAAFLAFLVVIICIGIKTLRIAIKPLIETVPTQRTIISVNATTNIALIGLISAVIALIFKSFLTSFTISGMTYFWILTAAIFAAYRIKQLALTYEELRKSLLKDEIKSSIEVPEEQNNQDAFWGILKSLHWKEFFLSAYVIVTIVIFFYLFDYYWHETRYISTEFAAKRTRFFGFSVYGYSVD